jgi:putative FmdB family regulatory protein
MPFYEYQCRACGAQVEVLQKITDAPLKKCPECGRPRLAKLVSAPVFRLKGGGWYETDFKSDKDSKRNLADTDKGEARAEGKAGAEGTTGGDGKAVAKSDDKPAGKDASGTDTTPKAKSSDRPPPAVTRPAKRVPRKAAKGKAAR